MTARDELDRRLAAWMNEAASSPAPAGRFERAMDATARRRPRSRWLAAIGSDWVGVTAPGRVKWAWPGSRRELLLGALVALLVAAAIVGAALVGAQLLRTDQNPLPKPVTNGWITFSGIDDGPAAASGHHLHLVSESGSIKRIVGTDSDNLDMVCPSFSADATRLAFGQAELTSPSATDYTNAALVVADIDPDGIVSNARTIPVAGTSDPPCPIWSPDGRRIAFVFGWTDALSAQPAGTGAVWVVTLDSGQVKVLPNVTAGDLDWAPDGSRLAIASGNQPGALVRTGGPLLVYSVASGEVSPLPGVSGVVALAWSPDGSRIAYQRIRTPGTPADGGIVAGSETQEIWTIRADGSGRTLQTKPFDNNHGIGPVWSPAGDRIVYERVCAKYPSAANPLVLSGPCRERHDVVVLTPGGTSSETNPVGSEVVLPFARVNGANGPETLFPYQVSWSPDGQKLLYLAWSDVIAPGLDHSLTALAAVSVDGRSPPTLLHEAEDIGLGLEFPAMIHPNAWGRLNDPLGPRPVETLPPASPTASPTAPPGFELPAPEVKKGRLDPGSYTYFGVDQAGFNVRFTVPAGWTWNGRYLSKGGVGLPGGAAIFFFGGPVRAYTDPCHWAGAQSNPPSSPAVDNLMVALAAQPMRGGAATPINRPANVPGLAGRWPGMAIELTVPDDINFADCDGGQFRSWGPENNARIHQGPGQRDLVWEVFIPGAGSSSGGLVIDAASFPGTPADVMSEIEAILGSIATGHWG